MREISSPRPLPPKLRLVPASSWWKRWKELGQPGFIHPDAGVADGDGPVHSPILS